MTLPRSLLLGIAIILVQQQTSKALPGEVGLDTIWPLFVLLPIPYLAARRLRGVIRRTIHYGGAFTRSVRLLIALPGLLVPALYACMVFVGNLPDVAAQFATTSRLLEHMILLAPLIIMEVSARIGERHTAAWLEAWGAPIGMLGPSQLPMTFFVLGPILLFSGLADLVFHDRRLEVFFGGTALGSSIGMVIAVLTLCVALPLFFRWALPTSRELPPDLEGDIRDTARTLRFPANRVLTLHTRHRVVNAAMVGPLPWPRYLVLSDGILRLLDRASLRGVVAHEIGHARARHPGLLLLVFIGIPLLLLHPLSIVDFEAIDPFSLAVGGGFAAILALYVWRKVGQRFEYEADQESADALGAVAPCIQALRRVGELYPRVRLRSPVHATLEFLGRMLRRHPSEDQRIRHLRAWERDPAYRRRHRRIGKALRVGVLVATSLALSASAYVHMQMWDIDRGIYLLYSGDFESAHDHLSSLEPDPPIIEAEDLIELRAEARAAMELVGPGGPGMWSDLRQDLAQRAWERGVDVLVESGAKAARPWLALALADSDNSALERSLFLYATAAARGEHERMHTLREHMFMIGVPQRIGDALKVGR